MFLNWLISLSLATNPNTTWLIKAPQAHPQEFFVYAQNSDAKKISQFFTQCEDVPLLNQWIQEAQFHFLSGSLNEAKIKFNRIIELKWKCDWRDDERKIITFSFFRLAQISQLPSEQLSFITEAINFDDALKPDASLFPPPLIELYNQTKMQLAQQSTLIPAFAKKFTALYRNGKFISLNSLTLKTYSLRARLTLISDTYRPETLLLSPKEFENLQLEPHPLVDGNCDKYTLSEELKNISSYKVFFTHECIKESPAIAPLPLAASPQFTPDISKATNLNPHQKSWLERNLLWVGVAVVSSVAISQMMKSNQRTETVVRPTNTLSDGK